MSQFEQPQSNPSQQGNHLQGIDFDKIFKETLPPSLEQVEINRKAREAVENSLGADDKEYYNKGDTALNKALAQQKRAELLRDIQGNA